MKVLVTGATGFVGAALVPVLKAQGHQVRISVRNRTQFPDEVEQVLVPDLADFSAWSELLAGVDTVVHLAARVHQMHDESNDPLASFRAMNTKPTLNLAQAAQQAGVTRFVFLSSVKVNGEKTETRPFSVSSVPTPVDPYGVSKFEAEEGLAKIAADGAMRVTTVRSPLIYGPGGKGNVARLTRLASKGLPVPFGSIDNRRTMISVQNLCDLLVYLIGPESKTSGHELVLAGDAHSPSTAELYRELAQAMGAPARLIPVPVAFLRLAGRALGRASEVNRLTESLEVEVGSTDPDFHWQPPLSFATGIALSVPG